MPKENAVKTDAPFKIEMGEAPPPVQRLGAGGDTSPYTQAMKDMPLPNAGEPIPQFFVPADVPESIKDAKEREKAAKESARKISNRISGIARRLNKQDAKFNFALRTRTENGVVGVRVYRMPAEETTGATEGQAPAPAAA